MASDLSPGISVVVPVYNSAQSLRLLIDRLQTVLRDTHRAFEILLVNDDSRDGSWEAVQALARDNPAVRGIALMRNYGQHNALLCGIRSARHDLIVTIDDDLQNPPEEIPKLLATLDDGFDVVYGTPDHERHGLLRDLASQVTKLVLKKAMGTQIARNISAFRAFRTCLRDVFASYSGPYVSIDVLLTYGTTRFAAVVVKHDTRAAGASNYSIGRLVTHAMNMMTGFSTIPLRLASLTGLTFTVFGIGVLAYVLIRWLVTGSVVPGFAFLASTIALFSGAQLFALGIFGEYLARVHLRIMDRPAYSVRTTTEDESSEH